MTSPANKIHTCIFLWQIAEYVCYTKHEIIFAWENSKVITTNNRYGQRLCLEAWRINMSNHALNRDDGAYLPEEYIASHWQVTSSLGYLRSHDCNFRSPLMKTLDWSVIYLNQSSERNMIDIPAWLQ